VARHPQGTASARILAKEFRKEGARGDVSRVPVGRPGLNVIQVAVGDGREHIGHAAVMFYMAAE
jgi:hypothetical protein